MSKVWTTPRTWVTNEKPTAAQFNTHLRDNLEFLAGPDRAYAYRSSDQTIATASWDVISMGAENYDTNGLHSNSTNPSRITAAVAGLYLVTAQVNFAGSSTGDRRLQIRKNAGGTQANGTLWGQDNRRATASNNTVSNLSAQVPLAAGDYVELFVYQDSGGNLAANGGQDMTWMSVCRLGD